MRLVAITLCSLFFIVTMNTYAGQIYCPKLIHCDYNSICDVPQPFRGAVVRGDIENKTFSFRYAYSDPNGVDRYYCHYVGYRKAEIDIVSEEKIQPDINAPGNRWIKKGRHNSCIGGEGNPIYCPFTSVN